MDKAWVLFSWVCIVGGGALAMVTARGCAPEREPVPAAIVCPSQCEVDVEPVGGMRLRATCWCDR